MVFLLFLTGVVFLIYGVIYIFSKDDAWKIQNKDYRRMGLVSERTPEWETDATLAGLFMVVAGLMCLGLGIGIYSHKNKSNEFPPPFGYENQVIEKRKK